MTTNVAGTQGTELRWNFHATADYPPPFGEACDQFVTFQAITGKARLFRFKGKSERIVLN